MKWVLFCHILNTELNIYNFSTGQHFNCYEIKQTYEGFTGTYGLLLHQTKVIEANTLATKFTELNTSLIKPVFY
jgi:hypothetical protein